MNWSYIAGFFDGEGSIVLIRPGQYKETDYVGKQEVYHHF